MRVELNIRNRRYSLEKDRGALDDMVLEFSRLLGDLNINYVVVSGYVAILFGRSRISEDIDIIIDEISPSKFFKLWNSAKEKFWCIITDDAENAYTDYLSAGYAIRFSFKNMVIPNIEIKFPKTEFERWVLEEHLVANVDSQNINISPIEAQIVFKLYLGSEKDIEDAKYLYSLFKESLNYDILDDLIRGFGVEDLARRYFR